MDFIKMFIVFYQIKNKVNKMLTRRFLGFPDVLQKYIFASHFVIQNVTNAFLHCRAQHQMHFCKENLIFVHCAKQNVSKNLNLNLLLKIIDKIFSFT